MVKFLNNNNFMIVSNKRGRMNCFSTQKKS